MPFLKSRTVKSLLFPNWAETSLMLGIAYLSARVTKFYFL